MNKRTLPKKTDSATFTSRSGPRRILMTADTVGGVWDFALELIRGLRQYETEVALATMGLPLTPEQRKDTEKIRNLALFESNYRLEWMEDPWDDVEKCGEWLLSLQEKIQPDLVHLNGYAHASLPWKCPALVVAHSCVLSWWDAVMGGDPPPALQPYRQRVMQGLSGADLIAAPTRTMLRNIEQCYTPVPNGKVIHNGRCHRTFRPGKKEEYVLSAGRIWDDAKNIRSVANAARKLPWPVLVAGEERHPEGGAGPVENVVKLGQVPSEKIPAWFASASIYALPARYEPFGLTVLEAALSRCALLLGDIPSLRELWDGAAVFVPPDDPVALEEELRALCIHRERREKMAGLAFERSREFSADRMTAGYAAAYASLNPGFRTRPDA